MECPYCKKEMELGYIQSQSGVTWTPKRYCIEAFAFYGKNSMSLANGAADNSKTVYAYRCSECKKVVIEYSIDNRGFYGVE